MEMYNVSQDLLSRRPSKPKARIRRENKVEYRSKASSSGDIRSKADRQQVSQRGGLCDHEKDKEGGFSERPARLLENAGLTILVTTHTPATATAVV